MKKIFTLLLCSPLFVFAQMTHQVSVFGGGSGNPAPAYDPQFITIDLGDIVEWENTQGSHNVYGALDIFPGNPAGFSSGSPQGAPWTFSHTFTVAGVYDYHCTQGATNPTPHSVTQFGTITVIDPNGVEEQTALGTIGMYPNPASEQLTVDLGEVNAQQFEIIQLDGRIAQTIAVNKTGQNTVDLTALSEGQYFLRITTTEGEVTTLKFLKTGI